MSFIMNMNFSGWDGLFEGMLFIAAFFAIMFVISVIYYVFVAITLTAILKKMNHPQPWAAWIPVYRFWVFLESGNQKGWWAVVPVVAMFLTIIPVVGNLLQFAGSILFGVALIYALINFNKGFRKEITSWTVLGSLLPPVWLGIMAWGKDNYDSRLANGPYFMTKTPAVVQTNPYDQNQAPTMTTSYPQPPVTPVTPAAPTIPYPQNFEPTPTENTNYEVASAEQSPFAAPELNPYMAHTSNETSTTSPTEVIEPEDKEKK